MIKTAERVSNTELSDNYIYQRTLLAYLESAKLISGDVLEIGTGTGYGIDILSPKSNKYVTIDKFDCKKIVETKNYKNVEFIQMNVPPLTNIPDNSFDVVFASQLIEHIKDDVKLVDEMYRVLKKDGLLILTTPNKTMSLTRNPFHVREYTPNEFTQLLSKNFQNIEKNGVYGNEKVMEYYEINKESVKKFEKFDIFNLQYNLPRWMLQVPYDILNRMNRRKILKNNEDISINITTEDFYVKEADETCLDLFYIVKK